MLGAVMVALLLATPGALADFACDSGTLSSTCVVSTAQVITAPITGADLTIESGGSLTCDTPLCEASIALTGTLVVAGTIKAGNVHVSAADITVSGTVSADYLGYPAARGPGAGHNATVHSCDSRFSGSGGAHGGNGGTANSKTAYSGCDISPSFNAVGGDGYGDLYEPTTPGSGGQHAWHYGTSGDDVIHAQGGAGGGAMCVPQRVVFLTATSTLVLTFLTCVSPHSRMIATSGNLELDSGSISTNGHNGYTGSSHAGGGGAGGSVWITATAVTGTGSIVSNGGSTSSYSAGGGTTPSHGRLALYTAPSASHHVPLLQAEVVASPST